MNPKEPVKAVVHSDALVILTDWPEFGELDWEKIKEQIASPNFVDGKNLLELRRVQELGFAYEGIGQGKVRR